MDISACYKIGYILKPHGLKGGVSIAVEPDGPDLSLLESVFIEKNNRLVPYFIESVAMRADKAFVKFEEITSPESAAAISKRAVYIPKSSRPKSGRGQFYDDEVLGFEVSETTLGVLGDITRVDAAGPNRLLAVNYNGREILIPVNSPFITTVNKTKKKITVELPEGFLDIW